MRAHYQLVSHDYLLTLRADDDASAQPLSDSLRRALRSGLRSVWVDCGHVVAVPAEAILLLQQYAAKLWHFGGHLILCRMPPASRAALAGNATQPLAATLLDAEAYGLDCPQPPGATQA